MNASRLAEGPFMSDGTFLRLRAIGEYRIGRIELSRYSMITVILGVSLIAMTFASMFVGGDATYLFRAAGLFCDQLPLALARGTFGRGRLSGYRRIRHRGLAVLDRRLDACQTGLDARAAVYG